MNKKRVINYIVAFLIFAILIALDQITKVLAVQHLKDKAPIDIIDNVLQLTYVANFGAAWGLMSGWKVFFIVLTSIMFVAIVFIYIITPGDKKYLPLRSTLVVLGAGAIGNLIDRIMNGYVHDFIYFEIIDFPVFNVADICVTLSMFVLIILVLIKYKDNDFDYLKNFFKKNQKQEESNEPTE